MFFSFNARVKILDFLLLAFRKYNRIFVFLDAAKRKQLPAWIREGLEKMERDKLKKAENERLEKIRKDELARQSNLPVVDINGMADDLPPKSKFVFIF